MNMKSLFLGDKKIIDLVYAPNVCTTLSERADLDPNCVISSNDLAQTNTNEVQFLFGTWGFPAMTEEQIAEHFPNLKAVFYSAGSVQGFAHPFLKRGVKVFSAWAANAVPVAEYTTSQILLANKGFFQTSTLYSRGGRTALNALGDLRFPGNFGCKIGIIGAGMIGKLVIQMLQEHNLEVLVFDPFLSDENAKKLGVEKCSLERLFAECQTISNHLANNKQTVGMLNYKLFSSMMPGAVFINTGRGAQVVEADLCRLLQERRDVCAVLDVTWPEPPQEGHLFYQLPNVIMTPHIAGSIGDEVHRMAEYMLEEYLHFQAGEPCKYEVTESMLATMA